MLSPPRRAFNLMDAVLLIVATALGFALWRIHGPFASACYTSASRPREGAVWNAETWFLFASELYNLYASVVRTLQPFCLTLTLTTLALRLRQPRPELQYVSGEAGTAACLSMAVAAAVTAIPAFCVVHASGKTYESAWSDFYSTLLVISPFCGSSIIGAWTVIPLKSGWRKKRDWIELSGRVLGVYWIGTIFVLT
jgi:hypothetical protein